ncbi:MAG TPA: DUF4012 domain-containing protein, partial [Candidatus Bathyarchaeia archaeon]|nr:DUF4012 domain-containing protein [Candidatus Bathyarchaeia archaeon]
MEKNVKPLRSEKFEALPTVLVIGGAGFIGSHLCEALLNQNCSVYCLDRNLKEAGANLSRLYKEKRFNFIKIELKNPLKGLKFLTFDYIFYLLDPEDKPWGLSELLDLAQKHKAKFLLLTQPIVSRQTKAVETITSKYFSHYYLDARIVRLLDVYGPRLPLNKDDPLILLFKNLKDREIFKIPGDGAKILYPLYVTDAVQGILKAMFSQNSRGKIYTLIPQKGTTLLEFINVLKKISQRTLGIEFVASKKEKQLIIKKKEILTSQKQLNWQPKVTLAEGVKKTLLWLRQIELLPPQKKISIKGRILRWLSLFSILSFILLIAPFFNLTYLYFRAAFQIGIIGEALKSYQLVTLRDEVPITHSTLEKGKNFLIDFSSLSSLLRLGKEADQFLNFFDLGSRLTETAGLTLKTTDQVDKLAQIVLKGEKGDLPTETDQLNFYLYQLWDSLNSLEVGREEKELERINGFLPFSKAKINLAREFVKILPEVLAFEDKKVYLFLLQNNMELRPTGGFITGFGFLTFEKGKFFDFQFEPVAEADRQLEGQIKPPEALEKYLGEKSWYLRDSNWDPDFTSSSLQAEWFLEKELKRRVDGTVVLNFHVFAELLKAIGPVKLSGSQDLITAENVFERAAYFKVQKPDQKDFSVQLAEAVFERIKESRGADWPKLAYALTESLERSQLLVNIHAKRSGQFFNLKGWDGSLRLTAVKEGLLTDYLMLVEANLGVNQVNFFLKRR